MFPIVSLFNIGMLMGDIYSGGYYLKILMVADVLYINLLLATHGIYLARIYKNGLDRPLYIVDWRLSTTELRVRSKL